MCEEWMPSVNLPMSRADFDRLPRNPAYRFDYWECQARLTPRPKFYHAVLDLARFGSREPQPAGTTLRPAEVSDFADLEQLFCQAFDRHQPFAGLDPIHRLEAGRQVLARCRDGGDGPWIRQASFVGLEEGGRAIGAIFVTLLPDEDPSAWDSFRWAEPPPADCIERRLGRPHVTWIFVCPLKVGHGVGTALLGASVQALRSLGFQQMASTFMLGNESSMLWHWRNGFELQEYYGSRRRIARSKR
jgi:GNAT superfamily N-acetyltransferase